MLTAEQRVIQALAREFSDHEIHPHAEAWDAAAELPDSLFASLAEVGFMGMQVPEQHGGLGLDFTTFLLVVEELSRGDASVGLSLSIHNGPVVGLINRHATEEQKAAWLPRLATGEWIGIFALSEAQAGSDARALEATARREGEEWVLEGAKAWVTNGQRSGLALVFARTGAEGEISCFAVPTDTPGWTVASRTTTMGMSASHTVHVTLDGLRLPADALIGTEGRGYAYALEALMPGRLGIAALSVGITAAALEFATQYACERHQFSQALAAFGATQAKLAEMGARLTASRADVHDAGRRIQRWLEGETDDGTGAESLVARCAGAKLLASQTAMYASDEAVQIYGGYGYMRDYPVERLMRDAKGTEIFEGTSEILRVVIARAILDAAQHTQ